MITGGAGNDTIDAGGGNDTVVFSGNWTNYTITYNSGTLAYTITDTRAGSPDGTDTVTNAEYFQFADGTRAASKAITYAPSVIDLNERVISISNSSFESDSVSDGSTSTTATGWTITSGQGGTINPSSTQLLEDVTAGTNALWLNAGTASQTTSENFSASQIYTLMVDVGDRLDTALGTVSVQLYAGNVLLGQVTNFSVPQGGWQTVTLTVDGNSFANNASALNQPLRIDFNSNGSQVLFDNVRLYASDRILTVAENAGNGTAVGTATAQDPNTTNTLTYSLTDNAGGRFTINSTSGVITVANSSLLNYESTLSHNVTIRATDSSGLTFDRVVTIGVTDVNEAPTDLTSGINLNTDGGNNAYLISTNGGNVFGGRTALTMEIVYAMQTNASSESPLISYAVTGNDNEVYLRISSAGTLSLAINNTQVASTVNAALIDGKQHAIAVSWDNTNGDVRFYIDGQLWSTTTGLKVGATVQSGGTLVVGQDQDIVDGNYNPAQRFSGTLYGMRVWNSAISDEQIARNYQQNFATSESGLVADWRMSGLSGGNTVVDSVSGNNLTTKNVAVGGGFTASVVTASMTIAENSGNGTRVGQVLVADNENSRDIAFDGLFREGTVAGASTNYTTGQSFGGWTVTSGNVDLIGTAFQSSPLGGRSVDLNGTNSAGAISQTLTTEVGKTYQVIYSFGGNFGAGDATKDVRVVAGGTSQDFALTAPTGWSSTNMLWSNRVMTFTANSTSTALNFISLDGANSNGPVIADVRVMEVPSSVAAILAADSTLSYNAATDKFYRSVSTQTTWTAAQTAAMAATVNGVAGQLVTIGSQFENTLVQSMAQAMNSGIFIGASDATTEGTWRWQNAGVDGNTFWVGTSTGTPQANQWSNWQGGEPNDSFGTEDYGMMYSNTGTWNDVAPTTTLAYVIEWDAGEVLSNFRYSLTDSAGGRFAINANTGEITIANTSLIDFEATTSHSITVQVTDAGGATYSESYVIAVTNANDAPNDLYAVPNVTNANITGYYSFAAGNNLGRDDSGDTAPITLYNSPTQTTRSGSGALDLAGGGTNQYGAISNLTTGGAMTVASWVRFDTTGSWERVFDFGQANSTGSGNIYVAREGSTNNLTFTIELAGSYTYRATATNAITNGTWMHFAATVNSSGQMVLYVNGVQAATQSGVALAVTNRTNNYIGRSNWPDSYLDGAVDDFMIANGAMSAADVSALYQQTAGFTIAENSSTGTFIGTLLASDQDAGNTYTYSLANNAGGRFAIDSTTGQITVANGSLLNFEAASSHTITARVTDQGGQIYDEVVTISLTNTNDAPVLTPYAPVYNTTEDSAPFSATISSLLNTSVADEDAGSVGGIAVYGLTGGGGTLQYSTNGGSTWNTFSSPSSTSALLLRSTDQIRFTPDSANGGSMQLSYYAWDTTTGTAGSTANVSTRGGTSAFSSTGDVVTINSTNLNDAPTITNGHTYTLTGTDEDTVSGSTLTSTILSAASWADVDTGAIGGMAITGVTGNGTWQYSTDGTTWNNFGAVTSTNSLLLSSTARIRYQPGQNGETATFTYRAWDQTSGTASTNSTANYASTASNGGTTAFSSNSATASMVVTSVNDAPTITNGYTHTLTSTNEDTNSSGTLASAILTGSTWADVDTGAISGLAITGVTGNGTWQYSTDGTTWNNFGAVTSTNALLITSTTQVRYQPNGQNGETATFTYRAWDQTSGTASTNSTANYATTASNGGTTAFSSNTATASMVVTSVNDAPTITNGYTHTLTSTNEDTNSSGTLASAILTGALGPISILVQ